MKEAKDTIFEICKDVARGVLQNAPQMIQTFSAYEKVMWD